MDRPTTIKKKRVKKTNVEKEIEKFQKATTPLIPRSCMKRVIDEQLRSYHGGFRITAEAVNMLQSEAEATVVSKLHKANKIAQIAKRDTVTAQDLNLVSFFET